MQPAVKYFIEPSLETVVKIQKFSEIHPEENAFIWEFLVYETTKLSTLIYSSPCWVSCWIAFELWQTNKVLDTSRLTKCASWISTVVHNKPLCYPHCLDGASPAQDKFQTTLQCCKWRDDRIKKQKHIPAFFCLLSFYRLPWLPQAILTSCP